jgi:DNA-binding transcriptional regulator YiaG
MPKRFVEIEQDWEPVVLSGNKRAKCSTETTFGFQLAEARRRCDKTSSLFAQSMGVRILLVDQWENNEVLPTAAQLVRINRILSSKLCISEPKSVR